MPDYNDPAQAAQELERRIARARKQIAQGQAPRDVLVALRMTLGIALNSNTYAHVCARVREGMVA